MRKSIVRLGISYVFDWVVVVVVAAAGGVLNYITGFHRPFSLSNPDISYPHKDDIVSVPVVVLISLVAPAAIIAIACAIALVPSARRRQASAWRSCLWEVHAGWLGLCTGLAVTLFITSGLKDMVGKPRPNLLAVCEPDLTNLSSYIVSGFGSSLNSEAEPIVSSAICQQKDKRLLDDSFAAFPSGHSSFSSAGMVYLSLWLFARFSLGIPYLSSETTLPKRKKEEQGWLPDVQMEQAAPPSWQMAAAFFPIIVALFICSSRYADFHHAGFDIISGAVIGGLFGWASFRIYHLPMRKGRSFLAWGPRPSNQAFLAGEGKGLREDALADEERGQPVHPESDPGYEMEPMAFGPPERVHTDTSADPIIVTRSKRDGKRTQIQR